ncbi:O-methyltransferase [Stakelama marina]|uniref:O-methyltransferase n=1 Tax=Stakelama marina TaxID=2826939 RepID=A0A8T4IEM3_9SPHN|nr:O-methyltransferase [Stakelama marina]MBR0551455.1 O-methyltransferase [Stakelama marina]
MADNDWRAVDTYIEEHLIARDGALDDALEANVRAGLPAIDVSPAQGKMLHLLARMSGARRILEIGTLGGYSTVWLARAVPDGGRVVTLEIDPHHAAVAAGNLERAGVADRVTVRVGPALEALKDMLENDEAPFDFVFLDADKENNADYLRAAVALSRPGTVIVVDNVVREGGVLDGDSSDSRIVGTRRLFEAIAAEPRLDATAVQTVGAKKWDGFALMIVGDE